MRQCGECQQWNWCHDMRLNESFSRPDIRGLRIDAFVQYGNVSAVCVLMLGFQTYTCLSIPYLQSNARSESEHVLN